MNSIKALNRILKYIEEMYRFNETSVVLTNTDFEMILRDLEILEKLKAKTHLLYKDRKAIAKEFDKWCKNNDADNCSENMATWFLSIKLKEWLEDE